MENQSEYNLRSKKSTQTDNQINKTLFHEDIGSIEINRETDRDPSSNNENIISIPEMDVTDDFTDKSESTISAVDIDNWSAAILSSSPVAISATTTSNTDIPALSHNQQITHTTPPIRTRVADTVLDSSILSKDDPTTLTPAYAPITSDVTNPVTSAVIDPFAQLAKLITDSHLALKYDIESKLEKQNAALEFKLEQQNAVLKSDIENQNAVLKSDIESKLEKQNAALETKIKTEIQTNYALIENKFTQISNEQLSLKTEINHLKVIHENLTKEIDQIHIQIDTRLEARETNIREHLIEDLVKQKKEISQIIVTENQNTQFKLQEQINLIKSETNKNIEAVRCENYQQINQVTSQINQLKLELTPDIETNKTQIEELKESMQACQDKILKMPITSNAQITQTPTPINVVCNGKSTLTPEINCPKFIGKTYNAQEFLAKLKRYYEKNVQLNPPNDTNEYLIDLIDSCMEGHASKWFHLVKNDITSWSDFQNIFEAKYWNRDIQRGVKQRIENERYRPNGKLSRSEYFIERVLTLKSLNPPLDEKEILICLTDHFGELIQNACRVQNIQSIVAFEALLQREDLKGQIRSPTSSRRNLNQNERPHENQHFNGNQNTTNNSHYTRGYNDNRAYYPPKHHPYNRRPDDHQHNKNPPRNDYYGRTTYNYQDPRQFPNPQQNRQYQTDNRPHSYPSQEQNKVCTAIIDQTSSQSPGASPRNLNG